MQEQKPTYEDLIKENADLKLELTEVKAQMAELHRLMYGTKSELRSGGSSYTPAKKKRKKK